LNNDKDIAPEGVDKEIICDVVIGESRSYYKEEEKEERKEVQKYQKCN